MNSQSVTNFFNKISLYPSSKRDCPYIVSEHKGKKNWMTGKENLVLPTYIFSF